MTLDQATPTTRVTEISPGTFLLHTPVSARPGRVGFSFNQYLIVDDEPLVFHTGPRKMFPLVREAISRIIPMSSLRWIAFSHLESDECGAMNEFLAEAPAARPLCSKIGALVSMSDVTDRDPRGMSDGEEIVLGKRSLTWMDAPHFPHGWDCGFLSEPATRTLFCSDLFTQPGAEHEPVVEHDILEPSEAFRRAIDYYAHGKGARSILDKLIASNPQTLACMHGSAWRGDGARLLRALGEALGD